MIVFLTLRQTEKWSLAETLIRIFLMSGPFFQSVLILNLFCCSMLLLTICRKLMNKFTEWIKNDPDFGNGTGEEAFIALWQHTQTPELCDDFIKWRQKWQSL